MTRQPSGPPDSAAPCSHEALDEREQYCRALFDLSTYGILMTRIDGTVLDANPAACEMLGMTVEEIRARGRAGLLAPGEEAEGGLRERAEHGRVATEVDFIRKDGTTFPVELSSVIMPDASPVPRAFTMFSDISRRKSSEAALRESDDRYQRLLDVAHDVAWQMDEKARFTYVSPKMLELMGYEPEEMLGKSPYDFLAPGELERLAEPARALREERVAFADMEAVYTRKDGSPVVTEITGVPVFAEDGSYKGYWGVYRDISERRRMEEALRQSEDRYRQLVEAAHDWVWEADENARYTFASPKVKEILGYEPEEVLGKTPFDLKPPDEAERVAALLRPVAAAREPFFDLENTNIHKDGHLVVVETTGVPVLDSQGSFRGFRGVDRDITERKHAEETLRQSAEQQRQSQKMEAVGRLAGGIAHDFNNLLTTIIGYSDLMMSDLEFEKTAWFEDVQEVKAAAERAGGLIQQILAFSRRQRLESEVVSVNSLVAEIAPLLRRTLGEDIEVVTHLDPDIGLVDIDPQQFTQALMNLAVNSRDAMPSGGRLAFRTDNVRIDDRSPIKDPDIRPGGYVRVAVSDTGAGIEPSALPLIYEPFYTTKPQGQGTGLGLPTVYGVVKQSGGAITVESIPGEGTTFEIFLPQVEGTRGPQSHGAGPEDERISPEAPAQQQVLLVEDEEAVRRLTERILKQLGYAVQAVANGPEALAILQSRDSHIDLLLTDVVLPGGLDGGEIARRARALRGDLAVLYVSGYSRSVVLDSGDAEEEVHYLEKPFTAEQLALKVREALAPNRELPGSQRIK